MVKQITIVRKDLCETMENMKAKLQAEADQVKLGTTVSYADLIDMLLANQNDHIEVVVNQEGRFEGSKSLAGQTISYRVK